MFLQGDLQAVFDALYSMGAIDPVLKMDWAEISKEMERKPSLVKKVMQAVNSCGGDRDVLLSNFQKLDEKSIHYIAMEVAREFCEFQDRKELH